MDLFGARCWEPWRDWWLCSLGPVASGGESWDFLQLPGRAEMGPTGNTQERAALGPRRTSTAVRSRLRRAPFRPGCPSLLRRPIRVRPSGVVGRQRGAPREPGERKGACVLSTSTLFRSPGLFRSLLVKIYQVRNCLNSIKVPGATAAGNCPASACSTHADSSGRGRGRCVSHQASGRQRGGGWGEDGNPKPPFAVCHAVRAHSRPAGHSGGVRWVRQPQLAALLLKRAKR